VFQLFVDWEACKLRQGELKSQGFYLLVHVCELAKLFCLVNWNPPMKEVSVESPDVMDGVGTLVVVSQFRLHRSIKGKKKEDATRKI
jgi:hypothetical protein